MPEIKICPLTDSTPTCDDCMYDSKSECLYGKNLSVYEFARKKGVATAEMRTRTKHIKAALVLYEYADYVAYIERPDLKINVPFYIEKAYNLCSYYPKLGINKQLFYWLLNPEFWKKFASRNNIFMYHETVLFLDSDTFNLLTRKFLEHKMQTTLTKISLTSAEQTTTGSLYVVNGTVDERRGNVFMSISKSGGKGFDNLTVPVTWIPVDLTTMVNKAQLLADNTFRQAVSTNLLILVDPKEAEALFERDEGARLERDRILKYVQQGTSAVYEQPSIPSAQQVVIQNPNVDDGSIAVESSVDDKKDGEVVRPVVTALVQRIEKELKPLAQKDFLTDDDEETVRNLKMQFLNTYRNLGVISVADRKYVYRNTRDFFPELAKEARGK